MKRRAFIAASAVALARPAIGAQTTTIIHVPQGNLVTLDAVFTTAQVTRNAAAMVFEIGLWYAGGSSGITAFSTLA